MTRAQQFTRALKAAGYKYDREDDIIYDGDKPASWRKLLELVPEFTLDELASWQDDQQDRRPMARPARSRLNAK